MIEEVEQLETCLKVRTECPLCPLAGRFCDSKNDTPFQRMKEKFCWKSVKDKLPDKFIPVLCYGSGGINVDYYSGEESSLGNPLFMISGAKVTHWMNLPEVPLEK